MAKRKAHNRLTFKAETRCPEPPNSSNPVLGTTKPALVAGFGHLKAKPDKKTDKRRLLQQMVDPIVSKIMSEKQEILPYTPAYIYKGAKEQFVAFSWWSRSAHKHIREKVRFVVKKKLTLEQRLKGLQHLCDELNKVISYRNRMGIYHDTVVKTGEAPYKSFVDWLDALKEDNEIAKSTRGTIGNLLFSYRKFLEAHPVFAGNTPDQLTKNEIKEFIKFLKSSGRVGKTINAYLWAIQYVTGVLKERDILPEAINTEAWRVKHAQNETGRYRPLHDWEKDKIFEYCRENEPDFYLYLIFIYYTCIRPGELHRIHVRDVRSQTIHVPWFQSKNGLTNHVQILNPLAQAIEDYGLAAKPKDYYLFGHGFKPTKDPFFGKRGAEKWRAICDKLQIDDTANMYGLKHTFNVDYVESNKHNIDWEWLRRHNRHATVQQTQQYISGLTAYFLDETKYIIKDYHSTG